MLRSTRAPARATRRTAGTRPPPPAPDPEPAPPRAPTRTGGVSPGRGTKTCSPSATSRARLSRCTSAPGSGTTGGGQHVDDPGPVRHGDDARARHLPDDVDDDEAPRASREPTHPRSATDRPAPPPRTGVAPPALRAEVNAAGTEVRPTSPSPAGTGWGAAACCARATRTAKNTTATTSTTTNATTARTDTATRAPRNATGMVRTRGGGRCRPLARPSPTRRPSSAETPEFRTSDSPPRSARPATPGPPTPPHAGASSGTHPRRTRRRGPGPRRRQQGAQAVGVDLGWWAATHTSDA